jgi:tetratricopeptide (TPR) repeat protein
VAPPPRTIPQIARGSSDIPVRSITGELPRASKVVIERPPERISMRAISIPASKPQVAVTDETKIPTDRTRKISAGSAFAQLELIKRRSRRRMLVAAVAAPMLCGIAYSLGRQPRDAEVVVVRSEPVAKVIEPVVAERSLAESLLERAEIALRNGRIASPPGDNALEFILEVEQQQPASPRARTLRAEAVKQLLAAGDQLWAAGKHDSARTLYADALRFDPSIAIAKQRARNVRVVSEPPKDVARLVAEIDLAIIERRLVAPSGRNALALLQHLRRIDPTNAAVRRLGVEVVAAAKTFSDPSVLAAVATLEPDEKPRDPMLARRRVIEGNTHLGSGRLADARLSFEQAVAADSGAHAALAGLAEVAYNESDYTRAVLAAKRAIALAPSTSGYRMLLGKAYYKLLRYDDAIKQWKTASELDPANTAAAKNIEMAQHRMGR